MLRKFLSASTAYKLVVGFNQSKKCFVQWKCRGNSLGRSVPVPGSGFKTCGQAYYGFAKEASKVSLISEHFMTQTCSSRDNHPSLAIHRCYVIPMYEWNTLIIFSTSSSLFHKRVVIEIAFFKCLHIRLLFILMNCIGFRPLAFVQVQRMASSLSNTKEKLFDLPSRKAIKTNINVPFGWRWWGWKGWSNLALWELEFRVSPIFEHYHRLEELHMHWVEESRNWFILIDWDAEVFESVLVPDPMEDRII